MAKLHDAHAADITDERARSNTAIELVRHEHTSAAVVQRWWRRRCADQAALLWGLCLPASARWTHPGFFFIVLFYYFVLLFVFILSYFALPWAAQGVPVRPAAAVRGVQAVQAEAGGDRA